MHERFYKSYNSICSFLWFWLKFDCIFEWKIGSLYLTLRNFFDIFSKNRIGYHCIFPLHESKWGSFHMPIEVCVQMIMVFKQIEQGNPRIIIQFEIYFYKFLIWFKNKPFQPFLYLLEIVPVFETKLHKSIRIINLFSLIKYVESFEIFTFLVAYNLLYDFVSIIIKSFRSA